MFKAVSETLARTEPPLNLGIAQVRIALDIRLGVVEKSAISSFVICSFSLLSDLIVDPFEAILADRRPELILFQVFRCNWPIWSMKSPSKASKTR